MDKPFDAEIFATGTHNGLTFTGADLDEIVANFRRLSGEIKPPLKFGHNNGPGNQEQSLDGQPSLGWVAGLRREGDKLIASISGMPGIVKDAIKKGLYKRVSAEIYLGYKQGKEAFGKVLSAVALLGADIPAVKGLADLDAFMAAQSTADAGSFEGVLMCTEPHVITQSENRRAIMPDTEHKIIDLERSLAATKAENEKTLARLSEVTAKLERVEAERITAFKETQTVGLMTALDTAVKEMRITPAAADVVRAAHGSQKLVFSEAGEITIPVAVFAEFTTKLAPMSTTAKTKITDKSANDLHARATAYAAEHKVSYSEATRTILRTDAEAAEAYANEEVQSYGRR